MGKENIDYGRMGPDFDPVGEELAWQRERHGADERLPEHSNLVSSPKTNREIVFPHYRGPRDPKGWPQGDPKNIPPIIGY